MEGFCDGVQRREKHTVLCVGLDTKYDNLPDCMRNEFQTPFDQARCVTGFNQGVIDRTFTHAGAYKVNNLYYLGPDRQGALMETFAYLREKAPRAARIHDIKYADIGDSNEQAARFSFDELGADAVTVVHNPGREKGLEPFLERAKTDGKGVIVVCRMSHPGADEFYDDLVPLNLSAPVRQNIPADVWEILHKYALCVPLYAKIALTVAWDWNIRYGNCALVVGCTDDGSAKHLAFVRSLVGDLLILVPGLGAQGKGTIEEQAARIAHAARTTKGDGFLPNASRSLCPAGMSENWLQQVERSAIVHSDALNIARMQGIPLPEGVERPEFLRTRTKSQRTSLLVRDSDAYP